MEVPPPGLGSTVEYALKLTSETFGLDFSGTILLPRTNRSTLRTVKFLYPATEMEHTEKYQGVFYFRTRT